MIRLPAYYSYVFEFEHLTVSETIQYTYWMKVSGTFNVQNPNSNEVQLNFNLPVLGQQYNRKSLWDLCFHYCGLQYDFYSLSQLLFCLVHTCQVALRNAGDLASMVPCTRCLGALGF